MSPLTRRACAPLMLLALAFPAAARADDAAVLYDAANVAVVDITLTEESKQALRDDPSTYVPATFALTVAGQAFAARPAELKLKGHGSYRPIDQKAAFKLKFAKANRLLGLKKLTLNNMTQDTSMLHEALGYEVLHAAGVAAPRSGFAYVRVNGHGYGLYLNLETYDDVSLPRLFATTRHLYEADDYGVDVIPGGAGAYEVDEGDEDDRTDLEALIGAANATVGDWSEGMAGTADLAAMTRLWAGEQYLGHWDGYSMMSGFFWPNNYYLHSDATGKFTMLPTGLDQALQDHGPYPGNLPFPGNPDGQLAKHCIEDVSCLEAFRTNLGEISAAADAMGIGTRLNALAATVATWRRCPTLEQAFDGEWQNAVLWTRGFIRERRGAVATYLGAAPPASDPVLESNDPPPPSSAGCPLEPDQLPLPPPPDPQPASESHAAPATTSSSAVLGASSSAGTRLLPRRFTARVSLGRRLTVSGSLLLPAGLRRARVCEGRVAIRVKAGSRTVSRQRASLRRNCTFSASVALKPSRRQLTVQARFEGNASLLPCSAATLRARGGRA
jgi:hypothetical protein